MSTHTCPTCDTSLIDKVRFCSNCGQVITTTNQTISLTTQPADTLPTPFAPEPADLPIPLAPEPAAPIQSANQPYSFPQHYTPQQQHDIPNQYGQPQQIDFVVNTTSQSVIQAGQPRVVLIQPKSLLVAFLLTFFFGPLGLLYVTVGGALIFLLVTLVLMLATGGAFGFIAWIISMVWGLVGASNHNQRNGVR